MVTLVFQILNGTIKQLRAEIIFQICFAISRQESTDNTENILDLVFTNQPERVCGFETFDCQFALDHLAVAFLIKTKVKRECVVRFTYDFKKADFDALRKALSVTSLDMGFDESDDVDQCWES